MSSSSTQHWVAPDEAANARGISKSLHLYNGRKASLSLQVLVVGCGLGGLAAAHCLSQAGHRVTILESAEAIGEVGAGIQVSPNVTRLLRRWGLGQALESIAVRPEAIALRRYDTGELVGWTKWGDVMVDSFGAPYYHIHRADFHKLLFDLVEPNVTLKLKSTVVAVNPEPPSASNPKGPSITLSNGQVVYGDLIVGADGVKSYIQQVVLGKVNRARPTGDAAYRAIIPTGELMKDPDLRPLIENPEMTGWMGPHRHVMAYCIVGSEFHESQF